MSSVDNRVVKMQFDNTQFKSAAADTQKQLTDIDRAVAGAGKSKGLLDMAGHMDTVKVKAGAMQVATVAAIATIASKATAAGLSVAKSFTLDPMKQGFAEYELKMKSIQTILSNTKGENLQSVTKALDELNTYSDKTIYNFANMTENIGKLTTAGVNLDDATAVVKGFHNMVALAGGDATAAAGAMEQFSYGLQAGTIKAMDWMSISNRGLGSQSLQKAFFETARAAGSLKDVPVSTTFEEWTKSQGGFKASLEQGWLTSDVATKALKVMTGDMKSVQDVMKLGFDKKTAQDMLDIADSAVESATKVRTFTAFMGTLKESIASGWSKVFEQIVGDFNEATDLFTSLSTITGNIVGKMFGYISRLIDGWDKMGGRAAALKTIQHVLAPIGAILGLIAGAWKAAFGGTKTGKGLADLTKFIEHMTRPLEILAKVIRGAEGPMSAFFRLINIGVFALKTAGGIVGGFAQKLVGLAGIKFGGGGGGFVDFVKDLARQIGSAIEKVDSLLKKGKSLTEAFGAVDIKLPGLPKMPKLPGALPSLPSLPDLGGMLGGGKEVSGITGIAGGFGKLEDSITSVKEASDAAGDSPMFNPNVDISAGRVSDASDSISTQATKMEKAGSVMTSIMDFLKKQFQDFLQNFNFDDLIASFNIAVLSVFFIRMSQMMKSFGGMAGGFTGAMDSISGALGSFQTSARAKLIIAIAIAIAVLAASLWVLSKIPEDALMRSLIALAGVAAIMKVSLGAFSDTIEKLDGKGMNFKMIALGASMVLLAISISIIASAMLKLNKVDWQSVLKAGIALGMLTIAMQLLGKIQNEQILKTAFAMVVIAGALMLFAIAIRKFAGLDFKVFGEGMLYVAIALGVLAGIMNKFTSSLLGAIALVVVVGALYLLEKVIRVYADLEWDTFAHGMGKVAIALLALVAVMHGFQSSLAGAAAMVVVIYGLTELHKVIGLFANMDWGTFAKGMAMVAIAILVLGGALILIGLGAPAMLAAAFALLVFAAAVALIGVGLVALTAGLGALIALGAGLSVAITAFFTGLAVGFGVFMTVLAAEMPILKKAFLDILQVLVDTIVEAVPMIIDGIKRLWAAVKKQFTSPDKKGLMGDTSKSWMEKLKDGIRDKLPGIVTAAKDIIIKFINGLVSNADEIASKGVELVVALLRGIGNRVGSLVTAGVDLVVKLAEGVGKNLTRLVEAGIKLIADFLHALANGIRSGGAAIGGGISAVLDAMRDVGIDMVQGLINGVTDMMGDALSAIGDLASKMVGRAKSILDIFSPSRVFHKIGEYIVSGLTGGIQDNAVSAITAVASMVSGQIAVASEYVSAFVQKLDQQAIAASAKAAGLAKAAEMAAASADKAANRADKTKGKGDDKKANKAQESADSLGDRAKQAAQKAKEAENQATKAAAAENRAAEFEKAELMEKAKMRSEDAAASMDDAKAAQFAAEQKVQQAKALDRQAKAKGVSKKDSEKMKKEAEDLRKQATANANNANSAIEKARLNAADALEWQRKAVAAAVATYDQRFAQEAQDDVNAEYFDSLGTAGKASNKRENAARLAADSQRKLAEAKQLALTDLESANRLMDEALADADLARQYINDAEGFEQEILDKKIADEKLRVDADNAVVDFQTQFDKERLEDEKVAAFNKLTDAEKAASRRAEAAALAAEAQRDLEAAKVLAYTDLAAANSLAQEANQQADLARQYLDEATQLEAITPAASPGNGKVVDLEVTDAAAAAFSQYDSTYGAAVAAASGGQHVEFNQYNSSPEALSPSEVYRHGNNLVNSAARRLQPAA